SGSNAAVVISGSTGSQPGLRLPESVESPLTPLLVQFERLRQQSYDEFHQSMLLMLQMFNGLQRERLDPVREDLDQVYKLTLELQQVQGSTGQSSHPGTTPMHEGQPATAGSGQRIAALQHERHSRWHKVLDAVAAG